MNKNKATRSRFDQLELPSKDHGIQGELKSGELIGPIYDDQKFYELAENRYWRGDYEASLRYYSKALNENSQLEEAWFGQVQCLLRLGEYKEGLIWVDKALDSFPKSASLMAVKAVVYGRLRDQEQAMAFADGALNIRMDAPMAWIARGDALLRINVKNAKRCLEKSLEGNQGDWKLWTAIGDVYRENAHYRSALTHYLKAVELNEEGAMLWLHIGNCRRALGFGNFREAFQQALDLRPDWEVARKAMLLKKPTWFNRLRSLIKRN